MCPSTLNEIFFPPFLCVCNLIVLGIFWSYNRQKGVVKSEASYYQNCLPKRYYPSSIEKKSLSNRSKPQFYRDKPKPKHNKYSTTLYLKISDYLEQLDRTKLYRILLKLNLRIRYKGNQKSLERIRAEIRASFREKPHQVLATLRSI